MPFVYRSCSMLTACLLILITDRCDSPGAKLQLEKRNSRRSYLILGDRVAAASIRIVDIRIDSNIHSEANGQHFIALCVCFFLPAWLPVANNFYVCQCFIYHSAVVSRPEVASIDSTVGLESNYQFPPQLAAGSHWNWRCHKPHESTQHIAQMTPADTGWRHPGRPNHRGRPFRSNLDWTQRHFRYAAHVRYMNK